MATPPAVRRQVLWQTMVALGGGRTLGFHHVVEAMRLLDADGPRVFDAPGHRLERIGARLVLTGRPTETVGRWSEAPRGRPTSANLFQYSLSIPGEVELAEAGCVVSAEVGFTSIRVPFRATVNRRRSAVSSAVKRWSSAIGRRAIAFDRLGSPDTRSSRTTS